ncbi:hypothetical protein [Bernardetia sp.]|uniref:hypothetical protein n=1 Tax=Bernardetia sp. TaxID=1937974 RepID=UPI0025C0C134|nr:hypothetical protein [Bernardetia sp.]
MSTKQRKEIILLYQKSRLRIDSLFGSTESKPTILVGTTDEVMQRFGYPNIEKETKTGMTHLTPFGAYIVLSSEGTNVDVLSHELSHAELMKRLGWKTRRQKIPIWFDEGLAMLVDRRFEYWSALKEDWKKLLNSENTDSVFISQYSTIPFESEEIFALENLQTTEEFFTENAQLHYFLAQQEVSRWYKANGKKGLIQLIEDLEIKSFEESYDK